MAKAPRTRFHRCMYFETKFCASGCCPTPPPCASPHWTGPMDCDSEDSEGRRVVCRVQDCPCWSGNTPPAEVRRTYHDWKYTHTRTHKYNEEADLYGGR